MDCQIYLEAEKQEQDICLQPEAYNQASGGTIEITENGTYDVTKYQEAEVDVPLDISQAFNTTITATSGISARYWYRERFVKWEVLPDMVFTIDPAVTIIYETFAGVGIPYLKVVGGENVTRMGSFAQNAEQLIKVDLTEFSPLSLAELVSAFYSCDALQVANLGGINTSHATDMSNLFYRCRVLQYVNLSGWTTESITNNSTMFFYCSALKAVVIDSPSVFRLTNANALSNSGIQRGTGFVYVPDNLVDEYKSATNWTTVANQIKPLSELPQEVKDVFHMA